MNCGVGPIPGSDPVLLWLWRRLAAIAPNGSLAWEPPYAVDTALKRQKKKKKKKKKEEDDFLYKKIMRRKKKDGIVLTDLKT